MEYKGFNIVGDGTFGYKKVKRVGSGTAPKFCSGSFTSESFAKKAIDQYLSGKEGDNGDAETSTPRGKQSSKRSDN